MRSAHSRPGTEDSSSLHLLASRSVGNNKRCDSPSFVWVHWGCALSQSHPWISLAQSGSSQTEGATCWPRGVACAPLFTNFKWHTGILHCIVLCLFYKLKVFGNLELSKSVGSIFPIAFAHFACLFHVLVILAIFQTSSLSYLLWWSMINDLRCYYFN